MSYQRGNNTKQKIIDVSKKLFINEGFHKSTYVKIGKKAGVNPNLISYYFGSKKNIAKYILSEYFINEAQFIKSNTKKTYSAMMKYALHTRTHYLILSNNENFLKFYKETVEIGLLHGIYLQIPDILKMYNNLIKEHKLQWDIHNKYLINLELGCEREMMLNFKPETAYDETFIYFMLSIFPKVVGVPFSLIEEAYYKSFNIIKDIDINKFKF